MASEVTPFIPETYYHLYNHGNGDDNIFRSEDNYYYFIKKYRQYLHPVAETFAFCLMPNHFHFLIRIRTEDELVEFFKIPPDLSGFQNLSGLISKSFSNFFNAYSKAFNKKYNRVGRLFRSSVKRKVIEDEDYLCHLVRYIHLNPVNHGFVRSPNNWSQSSYRLFYNQQGTWISKGEVLEWFGGLEGFKRHHETESEPPNLFDYFI